MSASSPDHGRNTHGITINLPLDYTTSSQVLPFLTSLLLNAHLTLLIQPPLANAALEDDDPYPEQELPASRSASASSSLDPYYFGLPSPSDSPVPSLPPLPQPATTPDQLPINEPITPAKNPANIDRRGLVGVGELTTPRWTRSERGSETDGTGDLSSPLGGVDITIPDDPHDDERDSPWTIEAVDGEFSEKEEVCMFPVNSSFHSCVIARPATSTKTPSESAVDR